MMRNWVVMIIMTKKMGVFFNSYLEEMCTILIYTKKIN
jgi:hypothetical protein